MQKSTFLPPKVSASREIEIEINRDPKRGYPNPESPNFVLPSRTMAHGCKNISNQHSQLILSIIRLKRTTGEI
jgi:hypothetical protein